MLVSFAYSAALGWDRPSAAELNRLRESAG